MAESYNDILKASIGKVLASAIIDNYFPLVGEMIKIDATTKWATASEWKTQDGSGQTVTSAGNLLHSKDSKTLQVISKGELAQVFTGRNSLFSTDVKKTVYAMTAQALPYFDVRVSEEIIRTDGEVSKICIYPENGYAGAHTVVIRVYRENEESNPIASFTNVTQAEGYEYAEFFVSQPSGRGIYDVEADVIDTSTGTMFSKRINKLITVTPRLAPEPADRSSGYRDILATKSFTSYGGRNKLDFYIRLWENTGEGLSYAEFTVPSGEQNGTSYYDSVDLSVLPAGTTLVLTDDSQEPVGYVRRLLFKGNNPCSLSAESGTPNNTYEKPLVITINRDTPYEVPFQYYSGLNFENNCRHIVLDGRGYKNISKGIHIHRYSKDAFAQNCMFLVNGTSDVELVQLELSDCDFTAISGKTDPDPNRTWYWFGNWEFNNLRIHHCHIHDTTGEGFYLGYFSPETKTGTNSDGETVTYRPHNMADVRIYRNLLQNLGYDGMQLSNARGAEVCYNEVYNAAWRGEKDQSSAISIQSVTGKCYNNIVHKFNGPGFQIGPLGDVEVFNNVVYDCPEGQPGVQFLFMKDCPEQNPNGDGFNDIINIYLHNNVILCNGIAFNGRNTVQVTGLRVEDNIIVYRGGLFGNMETATMEQWQSQASGNLTLDKKVIDYAEIDSYKIADSANGDFRIAADSPLIQSGTGRRFKFDFQGYKNWFNTVAPTGAFLGCYKSGKINDEPVTLTSVSVNGGAESTKERTVSIELAYSGAATHYRIGETADLSDAVWNSLVSDTVEYTLSEPFGEKTVYAQVGVGSAGSNILSVSIEYRATSIALTALVLNNGIAISRHLTVPVSFTCTGSYEAAMYRLGETPDLSSQEWAPISETVTYTFDSLGDKTLYGQIQDTKGNISEVKSASINIEQAPRKAIVSLGWSQAEIPSSTEGYSVYDAATGITRFQSQAAITRSRHIYDTLGELLGTAVPSTNSVAMISSASLKGAVTGDDSGVYPDEYLWHNSAMGANAVKSESITFTLPAGTYKVRIFTNTIWAQRVIPNEALSYKAVTDTDETAFTLPTSGVQNNTANLTEPVTVTVGENGMLRIVFGVGKAGTYYYAPLNIIEIEEV